LRDRPDSGCPWSDRDHSAPTRKSQGARTKAWSTNDSRGLVGDCDFVLLIIGRLGRCLQPPDVLSKVDPPITTDADTTDRRKSSAIVRAVYPFYLYYTPSHGFGWYFDAVCVRIPIGSSSPKTTKRFYQNLFLENFSARQILWIADRLRSNRSKPCDRYNRIRLSECRFGGLFQSEATPAIVAGVCDPGGPRTAGLTEASHNAGPIATRAEKPACPCGSTPKPVTIFSFPKTTHRGVAPPRRAAPRIGAGSPTG
jgi:hypothetical protein